MTARPISSHRARSLRYAIAGACALVPYLILGFIVSPRPPGAFDRAAAGLVGNGMPLSMIAYQSGLFRTYAAICLIAIGVAIVAPRWRGRAAFAVIAVLVAWITSDFFKNFFGRVRPEHWAGVKETSWSYASGHATLTVVVYGLWAYFLSRSELPGWARTAVPVLVGVWLLVVGWSRLAMGAHYPTDVIGGWLLGFAVLALLGAVAEAFADVRLSARPAATPPT